MRATFLSLLFLIAGVYPAQTIEAQSGLDTLSLQSIFHEPVIPGVRPSLHSFSGDQESILFSWNDSSYYETGIYTIGLDGEGLEPVEDAERVTHSPDNRRIAYTKDGDIYTARADGSGERKIVASKEK